VQQQVHRREAGCAVDELVAADEVVLQLGALGGVIDSAPCAAYSWATRRKPPVPQAGSTTVSSTVGWMTSTIAWMRARGVKYWPAPDPLSEAPLLSRSS
jgi:hypothetical protein